MNDGTSDGSWDVDDLATDKRRPHSGGPAPTDNFWTLKRLFGYAFLGMLVMGGILRLFGYEGLGDAHEACDTLYGVSYHATENSDGSIDCENWYDGDRVPLAD